MRQMLILFAVLIVHVYSAPQFITIKDGKLGVNFGGYHAGVGLGGLLGGGAGGGLFAEAGTPHGQAAKAGLGGAVDGNGRSIGGLYAGATAGGDIKAQAGLGGAVTGENSAGGGFAEASAAGNHASSGLGGVSSIGGSSGFSLSATKSIGVPTIVKETEVAITPVETVKENKIYSEVNLESTNEVKPYSNAGVEANADAGFRINAKAHSQPAVIAKEVYVEPRTKVVEKHIIHTHKPHRHHVSKTAYIGGYIGGSGEVAPVQPAIERRVDVGAETAANVGVEANAGAYQGGASDVTYTKRVSVASNPNFFADIFNIPISTLKAVSSLLTNVAGNTNVSVQKAATVQAGATAGASVGAEAAGESEFISPKHASTSSEAHISVQTPSVSKVIDDIFSIPINTLMAVNQFLGNNIAGRKRVQVSEETGEPTKVRLGPHARRRANKHIVVVQEPQNEDSH